MEAPTNSIARRIWRAEALAEALRMMTDQMIFEEKDNNTTLCHMSMLAEMLRELLTDSIGDMEMILVAVKVSPDLFQTVE